MDDKELREITAKLYDAAKQRRRNLYKMARDLGFTPGESRVLSGTSEDNIEQIHKERQAQNV